MRAQLLTYLLFFLSSILSFQFSFAQQKFNYDREWKKVDSLVIKKGLTQSGLAVVDNIYAAAKKEKNDAQVIKALLYKLALQNEKQEDGEIKSIKQLENEIASSTQPSRSILISILAGTYQ